MIEGLTVVAPSPSYGQGPLAHAKDEPSDAMELIKEEESVSIAARHEQPISQAPSNVYVITDEDIRQSGAPDIPTILRRVPGVETMQMTGADFNVSFRGDNQPSANKVLVLIDGRSIYQDNQGGVLWKAIPVTLPEIKRIEVLKGPASVLYGFNAFDGVINIITKTPQEMQGTTLQFGGGEFGTINSAAINAGVHGKFGYRISLGRDQTNQWRNRDALAFRDNKLNVKTEYALSELSKVFVEGGVVDVNRFDGQFEEVATPSLTMTDAYVRAGYERPNFFIRSFWRNYPITSDPAINPLLTNFGPGGANNIFVTDRNGVHLQENHFTTYDIEAQHGLDLWLGNRLTYGINYRHNTASSNYLSQTAQENRVGFYAQDEVAIIQDLKFVGGIRYDLDTYINPTLSPRVAFIYSLNANHTLRASFSQAYRSPNNFQELFNALSTTTLFGGAFVIPTVVQGSRNLKPEKITSYEIGYQGWFFKHKLRIRADLFYNQISNLINSRSTPSGIVSFVNDPGLAEIYGGEAGFEVFLTKWLSGFANYSYQEISQTFTDTTRRAGPRFKTNAGFRTDFENGLNSEVTANYYGATTYPISNAFFAFAGPPFNVIPPDQRVGSYVLLNARVGYRFWHDKAEAAIAGFNSLNDRHREHPLGDVIGSRVMGWLTLKF